MKRHKPLPSAAFTRLDLLGLIAALGLVALAAIPTLANFRPRNDVTLCANNLRQIGVALDSWAIDYGGWWPWRVLTNNGGTLLSPLNGNTWYHYAWISNELGNPRVLACPADPAKKPASDFGASCQGGLLNVGFRNNAVSYPIGTDAIGSFDPPTFLLAIDRNLSMDGLGYCSVRADVTVIFARSPLSAGWTNGVHFPMGNALLTDGRVWQTSKASLQTVMDHAENNGSVHLLTP